MSVTGTIIHEDTNTVHNEHLLLKQESILSINKQLVKLRKKHMNNNNKLTLSDYVENPPVIPEGLASSRVVCSSTNEHNEPIVVYLSDVVDLKAIIESLPYRTPYSNIVLIKSPMGSGKTRAITDLINYLHSKEQKSALMLIYKKNMLDIFNKVKVEKDFTIMMLTPKELKEGLGTALVDNQVIYTYKKILMDLYAEEIIKLKDTLEDDTKKLIAEADMDPHKILDSYMKDRIVIGDESDYIINILNAFSSSFYTFDSLSRDKRLALLIEAARQFYVDLSQKAKAVILLTATTSNAYLEILPSSTIIINPTDYLAENEKIKSVSIGRVVYVPYVDKRMNGTTGGRLTDKVINDILEFEKPDKAMLFTPNVKLQDVETLSQAYSSVVIAPWNKISKSLLKRLNINKTLRDKITRANEIRKNNNFNRSKDSTIKPDKTFTVKELNFLLTNDPSEMDKIEGLADFYDTLTDGKIKNQFVVIITGSNCRAADVQLKLDKVVVITDAPLTSECIQAMGRFRNALVHVYLLASMISNLEYDEQEFIHTKKINEIGNTGIEKEGKRKKKSDLQRFSDTYWRKHSEMLYNKWKGIEYPYGSATTEEERIQSLVNVIEDLDFTLDNSMAQWSIEVDYTYCTEGYDTSVKNLVKDLKPKSKPTEDKKAAVYLEFCSSFPELSLNEGLKTFKELYPDTSISKPTLIRYRRMYTNIIETFKTNPGLTNLQICKKLKEDFSYNFESSFINIYRPK